MIGKVFRIGTNNLTQHNTNIGAIVVRRGSPKIGEYFLSGNPIFAWEAYGKMDGEYWVCKKWRKGDPVPTNKDKELLKIAISETITKNCKGLRKDEVLAVIDELRSSIDAL